MRRSLPVWILSLLALPFLMACTGTKTCSPTNPTTGSTTTCTIAITKVESFTGNPTNAVQGDTFTDTVTNPTGARIVACFGETGGLRCGVPAANSVVVTCMQATCPVPGSGFMVTIMSSNTGNLNETLLYGSTTNSDGTVGLSNPKVTFVAGTPGAGATPTKSCTGGNLAAGSNTSCTITLSSPLPPGSSVTDSVTSPGSAQITACSNATNGLVCGATAGNAVTLTCPNGCGPGAAFTVTITSNGSGPLIESLTLAPAGSTASTFTLTPGIFFAGTPPPPQSSPGGSCNSSSSPLANGGGVSATCTISLTSTLPAGGTLSIMVNTPGALITACGSPTGGLTCSPPPPPATNTTTLGCVGPAACASGSTFSLTFTVPNGTTSISLTLTFVVQGGGTQTFPLTLTLGAVSGPTIGTQVCNGATIAANLLCQPLSTTPILSGPVTLTPLTTGGTRSSTGTGQITIQSETQSNRPNTTPVTSPTNLSGCPAGAAPSAPFVSAPSGALPGTVFTATCTETIAAGTGGTIVVALNGGSASSAVQAGSISFPAGSLCGGSGTASVSVTVSNQGHSLSATISGTCDNGTPWMTLSASARLCLSVTQDILADQTLVGGTGLTLVDDTGNPVGGVTFDGTQLCGNVTAAGMYRLAIIIPGS